MKIRLVLTTVSLLAAVHPSAKAAEPDGDIKAGRQLAANWCSSCHVVGPEQERATSTGAPTFAAVAAMKTTTPMGLHVFFQTPHQRMPDLHLSNAEMNDVIAYIISLRQ